MRIRPFVQLNKFKWEKNSGEGRVGGEGRGSLGDIGALTKINQI